MDEVLVAISFGVWSDEPSTQLQSTTIIKKLLSQRDITGRHTETVIQSGVVPRLVQFLDKKDFPPLQYEAAWVLTNIAAETPEVLVRNGAVPILIQLLDSPKDYVREQAVWALGNVAADSRYSGYVLKFGALVPLLNLLYNKDTKLSTIRVGTWTLLNLCRVTAFDQVKPALELLVHSNDEQVLKYACMALWYLSDKAEHGIQRVIDAGFVPRLLELLQHPSPVVIAPALRTIATLVSGDNQQTECVINFGALPILFNLLTRNYDNNNIKKETCWTISNITAGTEQQIQSVIDANLIPTLVNLAQNAEMDIKKEAIWAISNVTSRASHDQIKYMVEKSCIKTLCDTLLCQDIRTILKCLDGLEKILMAGKAEKNIGDVNSYCQVIEDAEGLEKIEKLQIHENIKIYEKAFKILKIYWLEEDEETQQHPR